MAVKEEIVIEARAETSDGEKGLASVAKAAQALEDAEKGLASSGEAAAESVDDLAKASKAAEKQIEGAKKETREFYDTFKKVGAEAENTKSELAGVGAEAAKAGDKLGSASTGGKKFSDMLREIRDEADLAAGGVIEGIGGTGFVKALGGAGIAFGVAKQGVDAFLNSTEKMFRSYGPEGQAIWDQTEKKIFAIEGAFGAAVLGTDDLNTAASRMNEILDGTRTVYNALLYPVRAFGERLGAVIDAVTMTKERVEQLNVAENAHTTFVSKNLETSKQLTEVYASVIKSNESLLFSKKELAAMELEETVAKIDKLVILEQEQAAYRANAESELAANRAYAEATESAMNKAMREAASYVASLDPEEQMRANTVKIAEELLARDAEFQRYRQSAVRSARESALAVYSEATTIEKNEINRLLDLRENLLQHAAELELPIVSTPSVSTATTGGAVASIKSQAEEVVYAFRLLGGGYELLTKEQADFLLASETMLGDSSSRVIEMKRSEFDALEDTALKLSIVEADLAGAREAARKAEAEKAVASETALQAALAAVRRASDAARKAEAEKLKKDIEDSWKSFKDSSKALGLQNLQDALAGIGTTLGQTVAAGTDFASAIGETMEALVGQIAGQWGDLFLKQGIGLMFLDPVAGAGLLAAGVGLKALAGFMAGGNTTTDTGSTGASGVQPSATATSSVARPEATFGYFEGGRSPVTIVTNDAASIRTMQNRLNLVAARGGSGV